MEDSLDILVAEIASLFNKDFDWAFKERIKAACISYRATLGKQEFDKYGRWSTGLIDSVCLSVIAVKATECCLNEDVECFVMRTTSEVPAPIRTNRFPDPYTYVGSANHEAAFTFVQPEEVGNILCGTRFMKNIGNLYTYYNNYIYLFGYEGKKIAIRGAFANPLELLELIDCDGNSCRDSIDINEDMKSTIKRMILEEFGFTKMIPGDKEIKINE